MSSACWGSRSLSRLHRAASQPLVRNANVERFFGTFERTFTVPEDADATKIIAEFHDGVLQVHLPKHPMVKPNVIEAKVQ
jgi:HSP20 family molecular chaperone IbpA